MTVSRRSFLMGCSAAIAAMAAGKVSQLVFADEAETANTNEIMVVVFLRGGCDGLSLLAPFDDGVYRQARGSLALPLTGANAPLRLDPKNPTYNTSSFGLNASMPHLRELYNGGQLALVHACGLDDDTRSHFDAMDYMERGTPGEKNTGTGWITRHIQSSNIGTGLLPAIAAGTEAPSSLLNYNGTVAMGSPRDFSLRAPSWRVNRSEDGFPMQRTLESFYPGIGLNPLDRAGRRTLATINTVRAANPGEYAPRAGASYPNSSFGRALQTVAQVAKMEQGLRIATVDFGGWDTHEFQARSDGSGYMPERLGVLSQGLHAFMTDMTDYLPRLTVVVMSEFGRRLGRNASEGTDHGHGNVMMVLGGNVNGGKIYGRWPGLQDLDQGQDLRITTDYRTVLGEIVTKRLGNPNLGTIFPGFSQSQYTPLDLLRGSAPPIRWSSMGAELSAEPSNFQNKVYLPLAKKC